MIHGALAFSSIMGVLPSSPWLHFQNEGVSLEWFQQLHIPYLGEINAKPTIGFHVIRLKYIINHRTVALCIFV